MENDTSTQSPRPPRRRGLRIAAIAAAGALLASAVGLGAWVRSQPADASTAPPALQSRIDDLVDAGYPGVLAAVTDARGEQIDAVAGAGDLETGEAPPRDGAVRIASNTKMFVAVLVLQLVDEGLVELDEPIEAVLPGLVRGDGIDGREITVRQLLQHTSGLPEYADEVAADAFGAQHRYLSPRDMLDIALEKPAGFRPGERWEYSNTNYLLLGLLVERVVERPVAELVRERITEPLGLERTVFPQPGDERIPGEHPEGYHLDGDGELRAITELDPAFAWAAGAMISTPGELNRFMQALLGGELLSDAALREMQDAVPAGDEITPDASYGLGLQRYPLSCGGAAWGHGGDIPGMQTRNAVGPDGTAVTIAVNALPWAVVDQSDEERLLDQYRIVLDALDETLCDR
ncbi:serine hydrolase domain-containing protein [Homoserinibacter sp. YIM 151385]|uniref:serine hydrolase domain-containing protein n=1 Tax=Homoserinibacter sp. YIM 151385 TaxID=2985506 RepID=UPI0022F0CD79|nr:serine hydrolase domain-containing protein [Homoserinibacter sp. YIM 151385]WBU37040.1 serine hydrolase [Homoserinibacter sp. YIM 151385]